MSSRLYDLFKDTEPFDYTSILYGGTKTPTPLPVYKIILQIKGQKIEFLSALNKNSSTSILGHYSFLDKFHHIVINKQESVSRLIKKF